MILLKIVLGQNLQQPIEDSEIPEPQDEDNVLDQAEINEVINTEETSLDKQERT